MKYIKKRRIPEANIQAELYCRLKQFGIKTVLEYKYEYSRFDMVILDNTEENILAIIEVKSWTRPTKTKQLEKYKQYNIPVIYCTSMDSINKTILEILSII